MIRLDLKREPHWLDLGHGVRLHVRPCTAALMMAARAEVQHTTSAASTTSESAGLRSAELLKALARLAVLDWEGIGDADGEPAPLTDEATDALLDLWPIASAFERIPRSGVTAGRRKTPSGPRRMALRRRTRVLRQLHHAEPSLRPG
ncbi:MAG: hypothetical protein HWD60_00065 [Defluviicoccus sp.]|nr:MAG: hypothetical protein HWD60_00065 [Defluviicoccus sp.]